MAFSQASKDGSTWAISETGLLRRLKVGKTLATRMVMVMTKTGLTGMGQVISRTQAPDLDPV